MGRGDSHKLATPILFSSQSLHTFASMKDKQIITDLLFEAFRNIHTNHLLESFTDEVHFVADICLHGSNIFDIALKIFGIELNEDNYDLFFNPFLEIVEGHFKDSSEVKSKIEQYYDWLTDLKSKSITEA